MPDVSDMELLKDYDRRGSETAFAAVVQRHINLVYSVALRHVGIAAHAEEITQAAFIILARKAGGLHPDTILEGWLHETTRLTALSFLRGERRRHFREQEAYMQSTLQESTEASTWNQLAPLLDEAIARLGKKDRDAMMLRFFKDKSLREVATALNVNEAAAQRRVSRALEKLRKFFTKRGVSSTTAIIAGIISANSVQAAPVALAKAVTAIAVAKGAAASGSALTLIKGALKIMAWTKAKTVALVGVTAFMVVGVGTAVHVYHLSTPAEKLQSALHIKKPPTGNWQYPTVKVMEAIFAFGSNRADAFPVLEQVALESDVEARKQAIAGMGYIVRPALQITNKASFRLAHNKIMAGAPDFLQSEPSTNALPFLRQILFANNDLSSFALASLHGLFEAKDIPALAGLLVQSHNDSSQQQALAHISNASQAQSVVNRANDNQQLQRYLPEAIADTIRQNPEAVAAFIPSVEDLLDDANADIRFGAA